MAKIKDFFKENPESEKQSDAGTGGEVLQELEKTHDIPNYAVEKSQEILNEIKEKKEKPKRRRGRPKKQPEPKIEIEIDPNTLKPAIFLISNFLSSRLGEKWKMDKQEIESFSVVYSQLANKYMPSFANYGIEISALTLTGSFIVKRLFSNE